MTKEKDKKRKKTRSTLVSFEKMKVKRGGERIPGVIEGAEKARVGPGVVSRVNRILSMNIAWLEIEGDSGGHCCSGCQGEDRATQAQNSREHDSFLTLFLDFFFFLGTRIRIF